VFHVSAGAGEAVNRRTLEEIRLEAARDGSCEQGLSGAGRSVQQDTLGRLDAHPQEELGVLEGKLDDLSQLSNLVVQAADAAEADLTGIFEGHIVDERVDFPGKHAHDGQRRHIERNPRALLELRLVNLGSTSDDVARTRRGFYDDCGEDGSARRSTEGMVARRASYTSRRRVA